MSVKVVNNKFDGLLKKMQEMATKSVLVGIPSDAKARKKQNSKKYARKKDIKITNAEIGYMNEYGSEPNNIPPRPFLIPGIKDAKDRTADILAKGALNINESINDTLEKVGQINRDSVKNRIRKSIDMSPIAQSTKKSRERRGFKGEKPLIVTGQLIGSINYVIGGKNGPG
jgi:hypothetical protein